MKLGIVIGLGELEELMKAYIEEKQADMGQQLTLSLFLRWLASKIKDSKETHGKT